MTDHYCIRKCPDCRGWHVQNQVGKPVTMCSSTWADALHEFTHYQRMGIL